MFEAPRLLGIVELGGYPNLAPLYSRLGIQADLVNSQRKALAKLKKQRYDLVVCEFNFQSDFRDRSSNLESLLAVLQRYPHTRVLCFYQAEHQVPLQRLQARFELAATLSLPVTLDQVADSLSSLFDLPAPD